MPRLPPVSLTESFVLYTSKIATFTVQKTGSGPLGVADNASGDSADVSTPRVGEQWIQNEAKPTYLTGPGWTIIIDEAGP